MGMRSQKVQGELKKEISNILRDDLKDTRISFVTITRIDLTGDLRYAKVYFSMLDEGNDKEACVEGIQSASSYIRKLIGERLELKYVPELSFIFDKSIEYSIDLEKTFERIKNERNNGQERDKEV